MLHRCSDNFLKTF